MTAPTLSRERAVEIAERMLVDPGWPIDSTVVLEYSRIIAAIQDAFAAGVAQGEADRRRLDWLDRDDIELQFVGDEFGNPIVRILDQKGVQMAEADTLRSAIDDAMTYPERCAALAQTKQEPKYGGGAVGVPVGAEIKWTEPPDAKS